MLSNALFAEDATFSQNMKKDIQSLNVYPNPIKNKGYLNFSVDQTSLVKIEFYDLSGKKVKEMKEISLNKGNHRIEFNASELNIGIYLCKVKTEQWEKVKRILVKR